MAIRSARRALLAALVLGAAWLAGGAQAQEKLKVAAIYTVPVEQQWVSRIHQALKAAKERGDITYVWSENVANTDYERVMREYAEAGNKLILGEVFGVERAARQVAKDYPRDRVPDGLELRRRRSPTSRCSTTTSRSAAISPAWSPASSPSRT